MIITLYDDTHHINTNNSFLHYLRGKHVKILVPEHTESFFSEIPKFNLFVSRITEKQLFELDTHVPYFLKFLRELYFRVISQ